MSKFTTVRTKQSEGTLHKPLREYARLEDVEIVDWQIISQTKFALVVIEYEEVANGE